VHSSVVPDSVKPWPLQAFCPLQEFAVPLQALWPLQALVPPHFTPAAKAAVDAKVVAAKIEAAVAIIVRLFKMSLLVCEGCTRMESIRMGSLRRYSAFHLNFSFASVAALAGGL
jgi:hypothetical protein